MISPRAQRCGNNGTAIMYQMRASPCLVGCLLPSWLLYFPNVIHFYFMGVIRGCWMELCEFSDEWRYTGLWDQDNIRQNFKITILVFKCKKICRRIPSVFSQVVIQSKHQFFSLLLFKTQISFIICALSPRKNEERDWKKPWNRKKKKKESMDSILLSTKDSCEAHSSFQIHLLWMKIYVSSFMKLKKKTHKSKTPSNDEIHIYKYIHTYIIFDMRSLQNLLRKAKANLNN